MLDASPGPLTFRFADFELQADTGELRRGGSRTVLQDQPLRILIRLLERPGLLVTRDELRRELWPDRTFVDFDRGLNAAIMRLRHALADNADAPRFVETLPRRGYRFIVPVSRVDPGARTTVGRRAAAAAVIPLALAAAVGLVEGVPGLHALLSGRRVQHVDPRAYDEYLQGLHYRREWQAGGCSVAVLHLQRAIAIDPRFADAYTQLGFCYAIPDRIRRAGSETAPKARAALTRALALDDRSTLAHAMLARVKLTYDYDWAAAAAECRRVAQLTPDSQADVNCGELLYLTGHPDEGLALIREGRQLDPLNMDQQVAYGFGLRNVRRFDDAVGQLQHAIEQDPGWASARFWLAYTLADAARRGEAVDEYQRFLALVIVPTRAAEVTATLAETYAADGWRAFWAAELRLAEDDIQAPGAVWRTPNSYYSGPFSMARRYARLGDRERTFVWLENAYQYRHHLMVFLDCEPLFDDLRGDPRFEDLRRRVGLIR